MYNEEYKRWMAAAMACQGCGAVLFLLKKQWNYFP